MDLFVSPSFMMTPPPWTRPMVNGNWSQPPCLCAAPDQMEFSGSWGQVEGVNPFAAFALAVIMVMAEAWSSNRTPAPGMVARNDHLEGMLRNQGYCPEEIYCPNEDGYTMIDLVASVNGMRNPNLLAPSKPLMLPTKYPAGQQARDPQESVCQVGTPRNESLFHVAQAFGGQPRASAETKVGTAINSTVITAAEAQGPQAVAAAETNVGTAISSTIVTAAEAQGPRAVASAETSVETAVDSTVVSEAVAQGPDSSAGAGTFVGSAQDSTLVASAQGGQAEAYVENTGWEAGGEAQVSAVGTDGAHAEAVGVEQASVVAVAETGPVEVVMDATNGQAVLSGDDAVATTVGRDNSGSFDIDVTGQAKVEDSGALPLPGQSSGNSINASARGQDLQIRTSTSSEVKVTFQGLQGDNFVAGNLPQGGASSSLDLSLGEGTDRVELQRGAQDDTLVLRKTEGQLDLNLHNGVGMDDIGKNTTLIDAGRAQVTGYLGGSQGNDLTVLRGENFNGLSLSGGTAGNDQLVIDLPAGAAVPAVVTKAAESGPLFGLFGGGHAAEGAFPQGYREGDPSISAPGYESVIVRQDGQVVASFGDAPAPANFDQLLAASQQ